MFTISELLIRGTTMHATTYFGEFKLAAAKEASDLAQSLARLLCRLNHPSIAGRSLDLSDYLKDFLGQESEPLSRQSW
jgi:hypothetical protein